MGRRARRRAATDRRVSTTDRVTRLRVNDEVWAEFRRELGDEPISHALGRLVEQEVMAGRAKRIRHGTASAGDLLDALDDAHVLQADLETLVQRIEWRLSHPSPSDP